jgi:hypothetical protein
LGLWPRIPVAGLRRLRQENHKLKISLGYTNRPCLKRKKKQAWHRWLKPVILATQEAEIRRFAV